MRTAHIAAPTRYFLQIGAITVLLAQFSLETINSPEVLAIA